MSLTYKHISTYKELCDIKDTWVILDEKTKHKNICSSYAWVHTWWITFNTVENNKFGYNKELVIICGYDDDNELKLICPLMKLNRKKIGVNISFIEFIGQQWGGVYCDVISSFPKKNIFKEIHNYLKTQIIFDCIYLRYIPEKTNFNNYNLNLFAECPEIELSDYNSYESYKTAHYSKGHKQNLRTGINRAVKNNDKKESSIEPYNYKNLNIIINLSKSKLVDSKSWLYGDLNKLKFYTRIHDCFNSNIVFIKINEVPVAYRSNVIFNNLKLCTDASYDRNAPKYELGIHSVDENIKDSFDKKIDRHSLGPGLDPYKLKFTKNKKKLYSLISRGNSIKSYLVTALFKYLNK